MVMLDKLNLEFPFAGSRMLRDFLYHRGHVYNRKRIQRLMKVMGIEAIYPKKSLSSAHPAHKKYPYLLGNLTITHPNHVWGADITYIPMSCGFLYLFAIIDWFSRYVVSWELSSSLSNEFCVEAFERAVKNYDKPTIFNTDQGVQFTSDNFTASILDKGILLSMDGKGRAIDNVFTERLWRSLKYEEVYLKDYETGRDAYINLKKYFKFYNTKRPHSKLARKVPSSVYFIEGG
jgi:putative transposase